VRPDAFSHLFLQTRHPDLKEFVQVAGYDTDELQPFQQGNIGVGGLREHAH
jgi:hypothetical protein